eukprot:5039699-Pyramimonas_sp.AAC.1
MESGSSFVSTTAPSSDRARCHCCPFSQALMQARWLMESGLQLRLDISPSSDRACCRFRPFSHALIPAL